MKSKHANRYDWDIIQKEYDNGLSYRALTAKFGIGSQAIANAVKRGDLCTRSVSEATKLYYVDNPASVMGTDAKARQSKRMSENNPGGKCKWFEIDGKKVQGTWELNFAIYCNEHKIEWTRCSAWPYIMEGKSRNYTPDFYIPSKDLYVEIKGRWWGNDREKMDCVISQYPEKNILIIEKEQYNKLMDGELVW